MKTKVTFMIISCPNFLRMIIATDKSCGTNQNTFSIQFFFLPQKLCLLCVKDVVRARQATDDNMMQHRRDAICMPAN